MSDRLAELLKLASNESGDASNDKPPGVRVGDILSRGAWVPISDEWYDGAKWSRRETPADPFKEG